jgi:hypothetical protein
MTNAKLQALAIDFVGDGRHRSLQLRLQLLHTQRALKAGKVQICTALRERQWDGAFHSGLRNSDATSAIRIARRPFDVDGLARRVSPSLIALELILPIAVHTGRESEHVLQHCQRFFCKNAACCE